VSIRLRLIVWHTALLGLLLAGAAILIYVVVARQLANRLDNAIDQRALAASWAVQVALLERAPNGGSDKVLDLPKTVAEAGGSFRVQLVDPSGQLIGRSRNLDRPLPMPAATLSLALAGHRSGTTLTMSNERLKIYSAPLMIDGRVVAVLQVAAPLQPLQDDLVRLRLVLTAGVLGAALLAAALGWFLATKAMRPVDRLTQGAHAIGRAADLSQRLPVPRQHDELRRLALTFNEMLERLAAAFATQRQFLADASHELRTPLALIQGNAELALREGDLDGGERHDRLRTIAREANRMGRLVADLLALARADEGQPLVRRRLALDTLLLEVYEQARLLATEVRLVVGALEQVEVDGDPDRLKQLVLNLVDNALRYTPAGGRVTLGLVRRDDWAVVSVADTGPGIPAEHQARIFDRFYRIDQPRSRNTGGSGLGLAICRWIAEAHGGRIEVASQLGAGSTFAVFLPSFDPER
jgi:two-component system, OmpR family, sensor kinase